MQGNKTTQFFYVIDIPSLKDTALFASTFGTVMTFEECEKPIDFIYKDIMGAWLVWLLILSHAGAALFHHYVKIDCTLKRMTSDK